MRSSRQREMNYHNLNAEEYSDPLLQPFHQEWASQLSREDDSPQYRDSDYQQSDDRDDRESNRYQEDRRHKESRSHNVDRSYKSHSNERRSENYSQKNHDRSPRKSNRSYSPDERDKRNRRHSRDRSRRYSRSHSRERSRRYTRSRSRSRSLSRSRSRSRSRRSYNRDKYDDDKSRYGRKDSQTSREPPSNTIMLRGLAQHITQEDIIAEVEQCKIETKQIRLIRKKFTGASRGFAFVEFNTIEDAQRWMEMKQGSIMFHGQYRALMQYAVPRESSETHGDMNDDNPENNFYPPRFLADWTCTKCGGINFKRRENCFKCSTSRQESSLGIEGTDEISDTVTTRIIIQNLDVLTKEEGLRAELESRTPGLISLIVSLKIPRDSTTSLSRGLAYLTFNCEDDCKIAYDTLNNCDPPFVVDNKSVIISYCLEEGIKKSNSNKAIPKPSRGTSFTIADVPKLAAYSAELYAKSPEQKQQYLMYYTNYYMQQIAQGITISMPQTQSDETNSAAAVAHQAIMKMQNKNRINNAIDQAHAMGMSQIQVPTGTDDKVYAVPDISSYYYDQSSGYYYDVLTGLYYDPNTQYYYNSQINKFLYWDNTKRTYLLAPEGTESTVAAASSQQSTGDQNKSKGNDDSSSEPKSKSDKVKVAKRIAKDMERWAKTLNQKKEISKRNIEPTQPTPQPIVQPKSAVADICFSMVEKSERSLGKFENPLAKYSATIVSDTTDSPLEAQKPLVPSKFTKDPPMDVRPNSVTKERVYIDFEKLACLICKRQFASREILIKHTKMSTLHKQNLQLLGINT